MRWLDSITDSKDMNLSKLWETVEDRVFWHAAVHGLQNSMGDDLVTEYNNNKNLQYQGYKIIPMT